ncbi:MAG: hypothetical protein QXJ45_08070 [Thermoproteota archaeon]
MAALLPLLLNIVINANVYSVTGILEFFTIHTHGPFAMVYVSCYSPLWHGVFLERRNSQSN